MLIDMESKTMSIGQVVTTPKADFSASSIHVSLGDKRISVLYF